MLTLANSLYTHYVKTEIYNEVLTPKVWYNLCCI